MSKVTFTPVKAEDAAKFLTAPVKAAAPAVFAQPGLIYKADFAITLKTDGSVKTLTGVRVMQGDTQSKDGTYPSFVQVRLKGADGSELWWSPTAARNGRPTFGLGAPRGSFTAKVREILNDSKCYDEGGNAYLVDKVAKAFPTEGVRAVADTAYKVVVGADKSKSADTSSRQFWLQGFDALDGTEAALVDHTNLG